MSSFMKNRKLNGIEWWEWMVTEESSLFQFERWHFILYWLKINCILIYMFIYLNPPIKWPFSNHKIAFVYSFHKLRICVNKKHNYILKWELEKLENNKEKQGMRINVMVLRVWYNLQGKGVFERKKIIVF